jgi:hypothetical protein
MYAAVKLVEDMYIQCNIAGKPKKLKHVLIGKAFICSWMAGDLDDSGIRLPFGAHQAQREHT